MKAPGGTGSWSAGRASDACQKFGWSAKDKTAARRAVADLYTGGCTNLSGGLADARGPVGQRLAMLGRVAAAEGDNLERDAVFVADDREVGDPDPARPRASSRVLTGPRLPATGPSRRCGCCRRGGRWLGSRGVGGPCRIGRGAARKLTLRRYPRAVSG